MALTASGNARPLEVMFWNLESPGHADSDPDRPGAEIDFLANRIKEDFGNADIVGFCELEPTWAEPLEEALERASGEDFQLVVSEAGGHDRLGVAWRTGRFVRDNATQEAPPHPIATVGGPFQVAGQRLRFRPSVYVQLRERDGLQPLTVCVNHFARSRPETGPLVRRRQSLLLRSWLQQLSEPVVCMGDFNFDYHIEKGDERDSGFSVLTRDDHFRWVRYPDPLVPTEGEAHNGKPFFRFSTILDFIFAANGAKQWPAKSQVLTRPDDFNPEEKNSDHRPVRATFEVP
jgi:endonuclease/exonuclease/phosphatase family metal-dependent hydrolase